MSKILVGSTTVQRSHKMHLVHACNPSTQEADEGDCGCQEINCLDYLKKAHLRKARVDLHMDPNRKKEMRVCMDDTVSPSCGYCGKPAEAGTTEDWVREIMNSGLRKNCNIELLENINICFTLRSTLLKFYFSCSYMSVRYCSVYMELKASQSALELEIQAVVNNWIGVLGPLKAHVLLTTEPSC